MGPRKEYGARRFLLSRESMLSAENIDYIVHDYLMTDYSVMFTRSAKP